MTSSAALDEAMTSIGDATVSDRVVSLEVPDVSRLPEAAADLRYLTYVGLYDLIAGASLDAAGSDAERAEVLERAFSAVSSVEPVLRYARFEHGSSVEALERVSRMRGRDIGATEHWLIPRLEGDIAAYLARIVALTLALERGSR